MAVEVFVWNLNVVSMLHKGNPESCNWWWLMADFAHCFILVTYYSMNLYQSNLFVLYRLVWEKLWNWCWRSNHRLLLPFYIKMAENPSKLLQLFRSTTNKMLTKIRNAQIAYVDFISENPQTVEQVSPSDSGAITIKNII